MKLMYRPYKIHSTKKNKDYFYVSLDLVDSKGTVIAKGTPLLWINEDQYNKLVSTIQ